MKNSNLSPSSSAEATVLQELVKKLQVKGALSLNDLSVIQKMPMNLMYDYGFREEVFKKFSTLITQEIDFQFHEDEIRLKLRYEYSNLNFNLSISKKDGIRYSSETKHFELGIGLLLVLFNNKVSSSLQQSKIIRDYTCVLSQYTKLSSQTIQLKAILIDPGKIKNMPRSSTFQGEFVGNYYTYLQVGYNHREKQDSQLYFSFTDGSILSSFEMACHPYRLLLSDELNSCIHDNFEENIDGFSCRVMTTMISTLLEDKSCTVEVYLINDLILGVSPQKVSVASWPLQSVSEISVSDLSWILNSKRDLKIGHKSFTAEHVFSQNGWLYESSHQSLNFVSGFEVFKEHETGCFDVVHKKIISQLYDLLRFEDGGIVAEKLNPEWIQICADYLGERFDDSLVPEISCKDIEIGLNISSTSTDVIDVRLMNQPIEPEMYSIAYDLIEDLSEIIGSSFLNHSPGSRLYISRRTEEEKKSDHSLIRHKGFSRLFFAILSDALLDPALNQSSVHDQAKNIIRIFEEKIPNVLSFATEGYSKSFSSGLRGYLSERIETFLNKYNVDRYQLLLQDNEIYKYQKNYVIMSLVGKIFEILSDTIGIGVFQKSTTRAFEMTFHFSSQNDVANIVSKDAHKMALFALSKGMHVTLDDMTIESLDPNCLTSQLLIGSDENTDSNWFDLHPQVFFSGQPLSIKEAQNLLNGGIVPFGGQLYYVDKEKLPTAKWLDYFWKKIEGQKSSKSSWGRSWDLPDSEPSQILSLLALKMAGMPVIGGASWQRISEAFDRLLDGHSDESLETVQRCMASYPIPLKPFQVEGVQWMLQLYDIGLGGILADDMGLGKTIQALALFSALNIRNELKKNLVVVPTSLVFNWESEADRFIPGISIEVFRGKADLDRLKEWVYSDQEGLLITTYGLLSDYTSVFKEIEWNVLVADEAQNLKNIQSLKTKNIKELNVRTRYCLTGTPLENHFGEFFSLMDICVPGALGPRKEFYDAYVKPAKGKGQIEIEDIEFLRMKIAPLILRRTKDKILKELPEKTESTILLEFDSKQKKMYRDTALSWNRDLQTLFANQGENKSQLQMLTALLRLRQICSCPQVVPKSNYKDDSPKFVRLLESLEELREKSEPVVVFANFRKTLEQLETRLEEKGFFHLTLSGDTPVRKRGQILKQFENASGQIVLLMTLKAGGVGLNLTKARYVFHLEPWWNPQAENQATDRVHRMGQTKNVQIYRYIMSDSVEERIQDLKHKKSKLFEDLLNLESTTPTNTQLDNNRLTKEDFMYLLAPNQKKKKSNTPNQLRLN